GDFHDASFNRLNIIAHAGNENHDCDVRHSHDVHLILTYTHGLNHHNVTPGSVEDHRDVGSGTPKTSERAARRHATDVNTRVGKMLLHANPVAQNRAPGVGASGIHSDNADGASFFTVMTRQIIDQSALSHSRCSG